MPGGVDSGPFRKASSGGSSGRSSNRSCRSARGSRSVSSFGAPNLGGSSRGGARSALRAALSATDNGSLSEVAGKLGQEASQRYGSVLNALKSVQTDERGGVSRTEVRSLGDEYGIAKKESDRLFDTLDVAKEGSVNLKDLADYVSQSSQAVSAEASERGKQKTSKSRSVTPLRSEQGGDPDGSPQLKYPRDGSKTSPKKTSGEKLLHKDVEHIFHDIATKTAQHAVSVRKAFSNIQMWGPPAQTHNINRTKFKDYVKLFGYDGNTADQVFDHIDGDDSGAISYQEFQEMFGPYIMPTWTQNKPSARRDLLPPAKAVKERDLKAVVENISNTIPKKYATAHDCFRTLNPDHSGTISKDDVRVFFHKFAYAPEIADTFFDKCLTLDDEGLCDYREFTSHFTPYITQGSDGRLHNRGPAENAMEEFLKRDKHRRPPNKIADAELRSCCEAIGVAAAKKHGSIRKTW